MFFENILVIIKKKSNSLSLSIIYLFLLKFIYCIMSSIRVFRVSEKTGINFLNTLHYNEKFRITPSHRKILREHKISGERIGLGLRGAYLDLATRIMEYSVRKFTNMDIERPGTVCRGTIRNPKCEECSICLMDVPENVEVARMECNHVFHEACLLQWMKSGREMCNNCPKCRHILDSGRLITVTLYDSRVHSWNDIFPNSRNAARV